MPIRPSIPFLLDLLRLAMRKEASAVYIVPWMPPTLRIDERSVPLSPVAFTPEQSTLLVLDMLDDERRAQLDRSREIQFAFVLDGVGRFRVHAYRRHGQPAMSIRPYAMQTPTPRLLALPALACAAAMADRGLLLLTGRSPTLLRATTAALLEHRNRNGQGELLLLDDASRHWHERVRCTVRQGLSAAEVADALQRRAPPGPLAIAWGELSDALLLEQAVRAAERALCIVTLHADGLLGALRRLAALAVEEGSDGTAAHTRRQRTALALHGVLTLRPVPAAADGHDLAATEILMNSPALVASLADADEHELALLAAGGGAPASSGADEHLWQLCLQGLVAPDDAVRHAADRAAFAARVEAHAADPSVGAAEPPPATAPVTVDTGFDDLIETGAGAIDPFGFAEQAAAPRGAAADTQFDSVDWAGNPVAVPDTGSRDTLGNSPSGIHTGVQFHAWAPSAVAPGQVATIDLWAALPGQAGEVAARAARGGDPASAQASSDERHPLLTLQLRSDDLLHTALVQTLAWQGWPARARFDVPVPPRTLPGAHAMRVKLALGGSGGLPGLPIGELGFVLNVAHGAVADAAAEDMQAARRMLQTAYAAHADVDHEAVREQVRVLRRVSPGLDVFLDAQQLRSSAQWRSRIEHEVGRCERLFLFWSAAAAESPWVDFEWRLVLRNRGPAVLDVLLLPGVPQAPLPLELADLVAPELQRQLRRGRMRD